MMTPEAEENYSSIPAPASAILRTTILKSAVFVGDSSRMAKIFDPAEVV